MAETEVAGFFVEGHFRDSHGAHGKHGERNAKEKELLNKNTWECTEDF